MFQLRDFIFKGLTGAIGSMAEHQIILNAAGWHEKGVLSEEDLAALDRLLEIRRAVPDVSGEEEADVSAETEIGASEEA